MTVSRRDLHEVWTLTVTDGPIPFAVEDLPATVPGTFLTDLLDAGLIEDPYLDRNEHDLAWSGECDLVYRTGFTLDAVPAGRTDLVADAGIDAVAVIAAVFAHDDPHDVAAAARAIAAAFPAHATTSR